MRGRPRGYTKDQEAYMIENYHNIRIDEIAKFIGAPSRNAVMSYAKRLLGRGVVFKHDVIPLPNEKQIHKIRDGYDTVPWHMRIDGRYQGIPDLNYNILGLRGLDNDDPEMLTWLKE